MGHHHAHETEVSHGKAFLIGITLNIAFVIIEAIYGVLANSSALLADAGHNFSDVFSLVFAWAAAWLSTKKPNKVFTYGYRKTTILVSILNAVLLFVAAGIILYRAVNQLQEGERVNSDTIIWVALVGIVINTVTALLFMRGQKEDLNIRGAFLHMAADAAVFTESLKLALDAVPGKVDQQAVRTYLCGLEGVEHVHDLHIWALGTTKTALTAHLVMPGGGSDELLVKIRNHLASEHGIDHVTIQVEREEQHDRFRPHCS